MLDAYPRQPEKDEEDSPLKNFTKCSQTKKHEHEMQKAKPPKSMPM
jgi:hypothetical protein